MTDPPHAKPVGRLIARTDRHVLHLVWEREPLNVLDRAILSALKDALAAAAKDASLCAVVLRGGGEKAFSAGTDLEDHLPAATEEMLHSVHAVVAALTTFPGPTVAAVAGFCLGGGLEIAASCDLLVAEPTATFGQPEIKVGCFPPVACAALPRRIGRARAADLILTGAPISAARAEQLGLVSRLGPLDRTLEELLDPIRSHSRHVLRAACEAMRRDDGLEFLNELGASEEIYLRSLLGSHDLREGAEAFLRKRPPNWRHA